jgi:hypothetical protein
MVEAGVAHSSVTIAGAYKTPAAGVNVGVAALVTAPGAVPVITKSSILLLPPEAVAPDTVSFK